MASKSLFESNPILTLGAIVVLAVAADALAARRGGGGGGPGAGGGAGYHGGGLGSGGGSFRSSAPVHSGAFTAHADTTVRSSRGNGQTNAPANAPANVRREVAFHRHPVHHRGFRVYAYDRCYRWHHVVTPFGWTLRRVNLCSAYYGPYYD
jgi:hypothetical protein